MPVAVLPLVAKGPGWLGLAEIPGCYWPFRSFPVAEGASAAAADALLGALARRVRALRIGPVYDGDPALDWLKARALATGWTLLDRHVAGCYAIANSYDLPVAKHSPGKLLQYRNLLRARERGVRLVDWGAGDSGYKQTMGATPGPAIRDWIFVRPGLDACAARMLRGAWRRSGQAAGGQA